MNSKSILIDTDMGPDDWLSILFLGMHRDAIVKAVSISGTGESHGKPGASNCKRLLSLIGLDKEIPVAFGTGKPIQGKNHFPSLLRLVMDKMLFLDIPLSNTPIESIDSIELLKQQLESTSNKLSILGIGPLTNLALLLEKYPQIKAKIEKIVIMGGAVDVPGNIKDIRFLSRNKWAEWNIYCDSHAANIVFGSGVPIELVPLDATNEIYVDQNFLDALASNKEHAASVFASGILKRLASRVNKGQYYLWDVIAAAVMLDPNIGLYETQSLYVDENGISIGNTRKDEKNGVMISVCKKVDKEKFEKMVLDTFSN
jgi:pyrimidine-specific ribonucleoside hydrolase